MSELILLRHGESLWNKKNLFTGWVDVPLSQTGIDEATKAGQILKETHLDAVFTSTLVRAIMTAMITLAQREGKETKTPIIQHEEQSSSLHQWGKIHSDETLQHTLPVFLSDALNERMYGDLQGLNKKETMQKFGEEQVKIWRRSFKIAPPNGESLEMTMKRTLPYFYSMILPWITKGKNVLVVAHGNSLRSIIKEIEGISDEEIPSYELATGVPLFYEYKDSRFHRVTK